VVCYNITTPPLGVAPLAYSLTDVLLASLSIAATSIASRLLVWLPTSSLARVLPWLQPVAVGLLVGDALLHVLPESLETGLSTDAAFKCVAIGAGMLVGVECFVRPRASRTRVPGPAAFAQMNLTGDFLHHLVDGVVVAASFLAGSASGFAVMLAIIAHEIPREVGSAGVLVAGGYPPRKAFWLSLAMASAVPLGALLMLAAPLHGGALGVALALAAGTVLYVALADVLPAAWSRMGSTPRIAPFIGVVTGLVFMWVAAGWEAR